MTYNIKLEDRDLLQVSATVIAGALIFLTISAITTNPTTSLVEEYSKALSLLYGIMILVIFSISSFFILFGFRVLAAIAMGVGFSTIAILAILYLILPPYMAKLIQQLSS